MSSSRKSQNMSIPAEIRTNKSKKSVLIAYICWLFGGIFGLHHFYLGRDRHAFVWWSTLGGFIVGWLGEIFTIPRYVRDANEDVGYIQDLVGRMVKNRKVNIELYCMIRFIYGLYNKVRIKLLGTNRIIVLMVSNLTVSLFFKEFFRYNSFVTSNTFGDAFI